MRFTGDWETDYRLIMTFPLSLVCATENVSLCKLKMKFVQLKM